MKGIVLNSRPQAYRAPVHAAFTAALGPEWRIVDSPVLIAEPVPATLPPADGIDLVVFTSQAAVEAFPFEAAWQAKPVYAAGAATAAAARTRGFDRVIAAGEDVEDLVRTLRGLDFATALYPSAADISHDLARDFGARIERRVIYRMIPASGLAPEFLAAGWDRFPVIASVFSRRSAAVLVDLLAAAGIPRARISLVAIGAEAVAGSGWAAQIVAARPTLEAVADAAKVLADRLSTA